jgi:hypothetical protein
MLYVVVQQASSSEIQQWLFYAICIRNHAAILGGIASSEPHEERLRLARGLTPRTIF